MSEWREVRLGNVASVKSGFAFKSRDWMNSGVPVIKIKNVRDGRVDLDGCGFVSLEVATQADPYRLRYGDILVTMSGEIGAVGMVRSSEPLLLNQRVGRFTIIDPELLIPSYLLYALANPDMKRRMEALAYGVAQPNISPKLIGTLPVSLPDVSTQRKIAAILSALDDLIDNITGRIQILEEIARAIYREWFVEYRFPGHEGVTLRETELGPAPEGWAIRRLAQLGEVTVGGDWGEDGPVDQDSVEVACLRGKNLAELRLRGESDVTRRWLKKRSLNKRRVSPEDVVVEGSGECGRSFAGSEALERLLGLPVTYSNFCKRLRLPSSAHARYVARLLNEMVSSGAMETFRTGTTIPNLNFKALTEIMAVLVPPSDVLTRFEELCSPGEEFALDGRKDVLRQTRDFLLPRLIAGKVDVSNLDIDTSGLVA